MPFAPLPIILQQALVTDKDWAGYKIDIKRDLVHRVFVLHKNWAHLNWMLRSQHIARRRMRVTPYSLILGLVLFIMADWAGFSCSQRNGGTRSSKRVQLHLVRLPLLSFFSLCAADTGPNKDPPRREGMRINCFLQVQRAIPAACFMESPSRFHMLGEICSFSPDKLAWGCWSALWTEKELQSSTLCLASQQNKHPNPEIILSTWPNEALNSNTKCCIVVVLDIWPLVSQSDLCFKNILCYQATWDWS